MTAAEKAREVTQIDSAFENGRQSFRVKRWQDSGADEFGIATWEGVLKVVYKVKAATGVIHEFESVHEMVNAGWIGD